MSITDVGDALELTFQTVTGATVTVDWVDPAGVTVLDGIAVTETPSGSGRYPFTFLPTAAGMWTALFVASGAATASEPYYVRARSVGGLAPLAAVGEVGEQYGTMTAAQEGLAAALLRAASSIIRGRVPTVDTLIADGKLNPDLAALAAVSMVLRVMRNPGGLRSETVGPFSRTYDTTHAAGLLVLTEAEVGLLTPPASGAAAARVGTIMMRPGLAPPPYGLTSPGATGVRRW